MGPELESLSGRHGLTRGHIPSGRCKLTQGLENGKKKQFLNIRKLMGKEETWKVKGFARAKRKRQLPVRGSGCANAPSDVNAGTLGCL